MKFVFNNFDEDFKETFHDNVVNLYNIIQEQGQSVVDENYRQFFMALKNQTKNPKTMMTLDIINLQPKEFFDHLFSEIEFIEETRPCFISDIGA